MHMKTTMVVFPGGGGKTSIVVFGDYYVLPNVMVMVISDGDSDGDSDKI